MISPWPSSIGSLAGMRSPNPANEKKAMAVRDIAIPPFMILPNGKIDAKEKNPDVRSGFDISFILYAGPVTE
jgi:hypothetical protein